MSSKPSANSQSRQTQTQRSSSATDACLMQSATKTDESLVTKVVRSQSMPSVEASFESQNLCNTKGSKLCIAPSQDTLKGKPQLRNLADTYACALVKSNMSATDMSESLLGISTVDSDTTTVPTKLLVTNGGQSSPKYCDGEKSSPSGRGAPGVSTHPSSPCAATIAGPVGVRSELSPKKVPEVPSTITSKQSTTKKRDASPSDLEIVSVKSIKKPKPTPASPINRGRAIQRRDASSQASGNNQPLGDPNNVVITSVREVQHTVGTMQKTTKSQASAIHDIVASPAVSFGASAIRQTGVGRDVFNAETVPGHQFLARQAPLVSSGPHLTNGTFSPTLTSIPAKTGSTNVIDDCFVDHIGRLATPKLAAATHSQQPVHGVKTESSAALPYLVSSSTSYSSPYSNSPQSTPPEPYPQAAEGAISRSSNILRVADELHLNNFSRAGRRRSELIGGKVWQSRTWTPSQYAAMAQFAHDSFPFDKFGQEYNKSPNEVAEVFSAIIMIPTLGKCGRGPGVARGGLGEEKVKERRVMCKEVVEIHAQHYALEMKEKARQTAMIKAEVEKEVFEKLKILGVTDTIAVQSLFGQATSYETKEDVEANLGKDKEGGGGRGRSSAVDSEPERAGMPAKGKRGPKPKTVEDATADLTAASAELLKAKKAEERKQKQEEQRQLMGPEEKEKLKEERKRKRDEKKMAEKAKLTANGKMGGY